MTPLHFLLRESLFIWVIVAALLINHCHCFAPSNHQENKNVTTAIEGEAKSDGNSTVLIVVISLAFGLICCVCIVLVVVWLKCRQHKKRQKSSVTLQEAKGQQSQMPKITPIDADTVESTSCAMEMENVAEETEQQQHPTAEEEKENNIIDTVSSVDDDEMSSVRIIKVNAKLSDFQRLIVLQALRPDRLRAAMLRFTSKLLGIDSLSSATLDFASVHQRESVPHQPILLLIAPGSSADPSSELTEYAQREFAEGLAVVKTAHLAEWRRDLALIGRPKGRKGSRRGGRKIGRKGARRIGWGRMPKALKKRRRGTKRCRRRKPNEQGARV
ncbi:hypothetical protein niasHT_016156 [Heterodera trifolii]|uniref:Uncharacterized protein n=1 Tax=Heterodera trifolii TaxID=157864 RepID=A0ABD2KV21_9BILA